MVSPDGLIIDRDVADLVDDDQLRLPQPSDAERRLTLPSRIVQEIYEIAHAFVANSLSCIHCLQAQAEGKHGLAQPKSIVSEATKKQRHILETLEIPLPD